MKQVAAAIFYKGNKVFIARRGKNDSLSGKWEFPGGKLEPNETPEQCLHREIMEEFGVPIRVQRYYANNIFQHQGQTMELLAYLARMLCEDISLNVHDEGKWVEIKELHFYDFASADIPFVEKLISEGV
ncbi:MAG: CTP pyrophosphohydrolase [Candidatus Dichloromethanomonas elyunquensis]|nr:MAG: CTP pyrophosphohydrolase [Candidatus Dichloromethanomonas elyunquensis]